MQQMNAVERTRQNSILATNKVIRNTYMLLSMTLVFSAVTAFISMAMNVGYGVGMVTSLVALGLIFAIHAFKNSAAALPLVFLFTGAMGFSIGPMLNAYLQTFTNGPQLIAGALAGTGVIFFTLSAYAMTTRKDFSYMGGMLMVALVVLFLGSLAGLFLPIPMLHIGLSCLGILIFSGYILWDTSNIIHGYETNYITATVSLYINIFNLFVRLLHLLSVLAGRRD